MTKRLTRKKTGRKIRSNHPTKRKTVIELRDIISNKDVYHTRKIKVVK